MHLTNFHFYNYKNNLYSKPVKGLQGCGIGYGFGFNGKENDDETQTQDYGFRIYNNRLGRFLSTDPLSNTYPMLTPYQFASNTPIVGIDLDGLELRNALYNYSNTGERLELKKSTDKEVADKIDLAIAALKKDDIKLYEFLDKYKINVEAKELPNEYDENGNIKSHSLGECNVTPNKINYVTKYDREFGAGAFAKLAESDPKAAEEYRQNNLTPTVEFSATINLEVKGKNSNLELLIEDMKRFIDSI
jgi:RHS repeat-associated protein